MADPPLPSAAAVSPNKLRLCKCRCGSIMPHDLGQWWGCTTSRCSVCRKCSYLADSLDADSRSYTLRRPNRDSGLKPVYVLYLIYVLFCALSSACADSNGCDFIGSGLEQEAGTVHPVYLSCLAGRVSWQYPRAALRIILWHPRKDRDFHGCIKASPSIEGARLYVEGHRSLVPLYTPDDGRPKDLIRCFTSYRGQVALYLEAETPTDVAESLKKQTAAFDYDLQPIGGSGLYDPMEECRPCTESEIVQFYCEADFVAKGNILSSENDHRLQQTKLFFTASKVFQQTAPIFKKYSPHTNSIPQSEIKNRRKHTFLEEKFAGNLIMPLHCGARAGPGEFLALGIMRLGQPFLKCAPRLEMWKDIVRKYRAKANCVLET